MPKCCNGGCECVIEAGTDIDVAGAGTAANPYVITNDTPTPTPLCQIERRKSVNQSIPHDTITTLLFEAVDFIEDLGGDVTYDDITGVFTFNNTGIYEARSTIGWASNTVGDRWLYAVVTGSAAITIGTSTNALAAAAVNLLQSGIGPRRFVAGDTLKFQGRQTSTVSINANATTTRCTLTRIR